MSAGWKNWSRSLNSMEVLDDLWRAYNERCIFTRSVFPQPVVLPADKHFFRVRDYSLIKLSALIFGCDVIWPNASNDKKFQLKQIGVEWQDKCLLDYCVDPEVNYASAEWDGYATRHLTLADIEVEFGELTYLKSGMRLEFDYDYALQLRKIINYLTAFPTRGIGSVWKKHYNDNGDGSDGEFDNYFANNIEMAKLSHKDIVTWGYPIGALFLMSRDNFGHRSKTVYFWKLEQDDFSNRLYKKIICRASAPNAGTVNYNVTNALYPDMLQLGVFRYGTLCYYDTYDFHPVNNEIIIGKIPSIAELENDGMSVTMNVGNFTDYNIGKGEAIIDCSEGFEFTA